MNMRLKIFIALTAALPITLAGTDLAAQNAAHTHVGHVTTSFGSAPDGRGLAATATAEAGIALLHANFTAGDLSDLARMQAHAGHVHYLLTGEGGSGPGLGFGVLPAVEGVTRHIGLASESPEASQNVRTHAGHVTTIANSVASLAERAADVAQRLQNAPSIRRASPLVAELRLLLYHITEGRDVDMDGQMALDGEAGLQQLEAHLYLLLEGEGLLRAIQ